MIIEAADEGEVPAIAALVNGAYRGASAERGWTHEAQLLAGQRLDAAMLRDLLRAPGALLLLREAAGAPPVGCVRTEPAPEDGAWTVGLLTVEPGRQAGGLGRLLLAAAEGHAAAAGARRIVMTVIDGRETLIAWYERRGYRRTGATKPFPVDDERFGRPLRPDLRFVVLEKVVARR